LKLTPKIAATFLLVIAALVFNTASANRTGNHVLQLSINGAIGPATEDYIQRAIISAEETRAELVVILMDTPGGLDTAMRGIVKYIANSSVPVATYVAPTGSRAASAGTYILYASHIAAMAPGTNLGAATPVQLGGGPPADSKEKDKATKPVDKQKHEVTKLDPKQQKAVNDAVAYIRGLAELHGRNQSWAEKAVREAASLPASEALKLNIIDVIASDTADLLKKINGREILVNGQKRTLNTAGLTLVKLDPDWRSRLLNVITNPNIAYILMLIGIYGLIFEFSNPGAIAPGTVGAICLLLALYAFQLLPINYAGMGLILLGVALMVGEAFEPSFGILGIGGVIAFTIGSIILIDTQAPGFGINISVIITFTLASAIMFIFIIGMAIKARRRPVVTGQEEMVGGIATVLHDFDSSGTVIIHSETWQALTDSPLHKDQKVKVTDIQGLILKVKPLTDSPAAPSKQEEVK
jgi:membrane-bound serine protease (ClpP class)